MVADVSPDEEGEVPAERLGSQQQIGGGNAAATLPVQI